MKRSFLSLLAIAVLISIAAVAQATYVSESDLSDSCQTSTECESWGYLPWTHTVYATGSGSSETSAKAMAESNLRWEVERERRNCMYDKGHFTYFEWMPMCHGSSAYYQCNISANCTCSKIHNSTRDDDRSDETWFASPVFSNQRDCRAIIFRNSGLCVGADCRGVILGALSYCRSSDCEAMILHNVSRCQTRDCRGIIYNNVGFCESPNCRAVIYGNVGLCR